MHESTPLASRPSLRRLLIFEATVRLGSVGGAAHEIGLSQPAVTHALTKLEAETRTRLLERGVGGTSVTILGQILNLRTERMLRRIKASFAALTGSLDTGLHDAMARNLTDAHVRCHLAIVENGSFRAAAIALGISEPTLHRAARGLETAMGAPLYRRRPQGVTATPAAIAFAADLRLALQEIGQGLDELGVAQGRADGRLSIGCLPLMPKVVLAQAVGELLRLYPGVAISLEEGSRETLTRTLTNGSIDILLGALRRTPSAAGLTDERLFADPYVIVVGPKHPLADRISVSAAELAGYPWVIPWRETPRREVLEDLFRRLPSRPQVVMETSSLPMMGAILGESACITILSRSQTSGELQASGGGAVDLKVLPLQLDWDTRSIGITTRLDWLPTNVQRSFIEIIRRRKNSEPDHGDA